MNVDCENYHQARQYIKEHNLIQKVHMNNSIVRVH